MIHIINITMDKGAIKLLVFGAIFLFVRRRCCSIKIEETKANDMNDMNIYAIGDDSINVFNDVIDNIKKTIHKRSNTKDTHNIFRCFVKLNVHFAL